MTAITVKRDARANATPDKPREPGQSEAASFGRMLKQRRRGTGRDADDAPRLDGLLPPLAGPWTLAPWAATRGARDGDSAAGGTRCPLPQAAVEGAATPSGVATTGGAARPVGAELSVRFSNGAWAGLEMQAALHAGEVVVKLRPANRLQHKRLTEASASLTGQVREASGEAVRLEIADATR